MFSEESFMPLRRPETMKIRWRARVLAGRLHRKTCPRGRGRTIFGGELLMRDYCDPAQWGEFLADFGRRNRFRRARFETFGRSSVLEEEQEAHLENIKVALT